MRTATYTIFRKYDLQNYKNKTRLEARRENIFKFAIQSHTRHKQKPLL